MSKKISNSRREIKKQKFETRNPKIGGWAQWVIVTLFVALGTTYSVVTPIFEASDEFLHYPVVHHIATTGHLPIQEPGVDTLWDQEGNQPPLYYLISAALTFWVDTDDIEDILWRNPHGKLGLALDPDNKNLIIHTEAERFPWHRTVLAVHLIRLFSVGLGAASVALAYELIRTVWPEIPVAATVGTTLMAFNPMYLFITGSVNNDNLTVLLATWTLLLVVRIVRDGITTHRAVTLATVLALATITKISGLTLIPIVGLGLLIHAVRTGEWKRVIFTGLGLMGAWLVIASWWYIRNITLYNELLGIQTHIAVAGGRPNITLLELRREWYGFWVSYWGLFGAVDILMDWRIYSALAIITVTGAGGMVLWTLRKALKQAGQSLIAPGLLALYVLVTFVSVVRWTMITYGSQGRLMFPALAAISGILGTGLVTLIPMRWRHILSMPIEGALLILAAVAPFQYIAPTYAPPPIVDTIPEDATPINVHYGDHLELLAIRTENIVTSEGGRVPVTLYWRLEEPMEENYSLYLHALGREYTEIGKIDTYPGGGAMPTSLMPTDVIIEDWYSLELDEEIQAPTALLVLVGMWDIETQRRIQPTTNDGPVRHSILASAGVAIPSEQSDPGPQVEQRAYVSHFAELVGYDIGTTTIRQNETLELTLYWLGLGSTEENLTVFVHCVDEDGMLLAQADSPPLMGDYPTTLWQPGAWIADVHRLTIPQDIPPGECQLLIGFYNANDPSYPRAEASSPDGDRYPHNAIPLETALTVLSNDETD